MMAPRIGGDFLGALDTETDVAVVVTDGNERLETRALTGRGLLLHRHDLHDLILELRLQEVVHDLALFDWEREEVDLLERRDLAFLYQTSELGHWHPLLVVVAATATATTAATTATTATTATSETTTLRWSSVSHCC
jgi:magnesium-transporting ATPase (P-type)